MKLLHKIGDPHMGRDFKTGVPLHRRGDRERSQLEQLRSELNVECDINVMVGDLFDKAIVDIKVVHAVYEAYKEAAEAHPTTIFVALAGNHDLSRQITDKGSFHAFARMVKHLPNVIVLFQPTISDGVAYFPWEWDVTAANQVERLGGSYHTAIGHWDLSDFGGNTDHLCPVEALRQHGAQEIYSGHYHVAGVYDGGVVCTGSMQPYTHAEDPSGTLYRTLTLAELESMDEDQIKNMNLRVVLGPDETLPDVDCLSIIPLREGTPEQLAISEVTFGDFNLNTILGQKFEELSVPEKVQYFIKEKLGVGY